MKKFLADPSSVLTDPADLAMIAYVEKMTLSPSSMTEADVQSLRDHGFSDLQVLEIAAVCAQFNYVARMADALGIELEEHYVAWSKSLGFGDGPTIKVEAQPMGDPFTALKR